MAAPDPTLEDDDAPETEAAAAPAVASGGGKLGWILIVLAMTVVAVGTGGGLGLLLFTQVQTAVAAKIKGEPKPRVAEKYAGNIVVQALDPVVTNLAAPSGVWIRLELAMVFTAGSISSPPQTAAEVRQDVLAYARTMTLSQLESPSALQHFREDLNERATLRSDGKIRELIVQSMVVQ